MSSSQPSSSAPPTRRGIPTPRMPEKRTIYSVFLFIVFILYWVFVWQMERLTITPDQLPLPFALPAPLANALGIFHWRVLRHFIPVVVGWLLARELSTNLTYHLYDLPDRDSAGRFLRRLRDPRIGGPATATVTPVTLETQRQNTALLRVGGPGRLTIPTGLVGVTEVNSRYLRLLNSGTYGLDRFERVHSVLDLRPQDRSDADVRLHSREGLEVRTYVGLTFRVSQGAGVESEERPFPFDPRAVKSLAYERYNLPDGKLSDWEDTAVAVATGILASTVARFSLNQLLQEEETEVGAHLTIRRDVEQETKARLRERGIDLVTMRIGRFRFPEEVTEQYIEQWRTIQENATRQNVVEREAIALQASEIARAEAELELVRALTASMANARRQGFTGTLNDVLAVRFVQALERLARQSGLEMPLPDDLLPQLQNLQQQLKLAVGPSAEAGEDEAADLP